MGYIIVRIKDLKHRVRHYDGTLTPWFEYPKQAQAYIERNMGNSPMVTFREVKNEHKNNK